MKFDVLGSSVRPFKAVWTPALRQKFLQWSTTHEATIRRLPLLSTAPTASLHGGGYVHGMGAAAWYMPS